MHICPNCVLAGFAALWAVKKFLAWRPVWSYLHRNDKQRLMPQGDSNE